MKKMQKLISILACLALILIAATACSNGAETSGDAGGQESFSVGILQLIQHEALDAATNGFKDALTEKLGDKVSFTEQNAQGDSNTCATIANGFVASNVDLILANATPALQAAAAATATIPVLGTSITEYGVALDLRDFTGK